MSEPMECYSCGRDVVDSVEMDNGEYQCVDCYTRACDLEYDRQVEADLLDRPYAAECEVNPFFNRDDD